MLQQAKPAVRVQPSAFTQALKDAGLGPVIQVPCSYFKDWLTYLYQTGEMEVINPVNEALVMGRAAGRYLTSGQIPIVAIQNSGFMNTLNGLTSLQQTYDLPVFYIVTWRGEGGPGSDVPVHDITGTHLLDYLKVMRIPFEVADPEACEQQIQRLAKTAQQTRLPVALVIRKDFFTPYKAAGQQESAPAAEMSRFDGIEVVKRAAMETDALLVSSTGFPSRDAFAVADTPDLYVLGAMGHTFEIGLGIAEGTSRKVVVIEGDGSALMHAGGLADFDPARHTNLIYVVLDNASYESTGAQPTVADHVDWEQLAHSFRFDHFSHTASSDELRRLITQALSSDAGQFIHVTIRNDNRAAPGFASDVYTARQIGDRFMDEVRRESK